MVNRISEVKAEFKNLTNDDIVAIWNDYCAKQEFVYDSPALTEEERIAGGYSRNIYLYNYNWVNYSGENVFFDDWDDSESPIKITEEFADWYFEVYKED